MRVRLLGGKPELANLSFRTWDETHAYETVVQHPVTSYKEEIIDSDRKVYLDFSGRRTLAYQNVFHQKFHCDFSGETGGFRIRSDWPDTYVSGNCAGILLVHGWSPLLGADGNDLGLWALKTFREAVDINAFTGHYDRWLNVRPTMRTRANLAVFLAELRDIRSMIEILPHRHFKLNDWRQVLSYANGLHLNYVFGWKPFFNDLLRWGKAYSSFTSRFSRFLANEGRWLVRHNRGTPEVSTFSSGPWHGGYVNIDEVHFWISHDIEIQRASTFMFRYEIPRYCGSVVDLGRRAWLDSLGLNVTPANVWALLPWSFVIDWIVDVSGFLEQYSEDWIVPWVYFAQACSSVKARGTVRFEFGDTFSGVRTHMGSISSSLYTRMTGVPQFSWDSEDLSADKIRLGASLALSRVYH